MPRQESKLVVVYEASGQAEANVIKALLESEGIPTLLVYESVGLVFGLTVDGLGGVRVLVPEGLANEAREIIRPAPQTGEDGPDTPFPADTM